GSHNAQHPTCASQPRPASGWRSTAHALIWNVPSPEVGGARKSGGVSLCIRDCSLFIPLLHIGKKMPHLSKLTRMSSSIAASSGLFISPQSEQFDNCFNSALISNWLEKAHNSITDLDALCSIGDSCECFAHFWFSELQHDSKRQLLELEMSLIDDELQLAFLEGLDSELQPSDLHFIFAATLSEYPMELLNKQKPYVFLDYLNLLSSEHTTGYNKFMLSSINYTTANPQLSQWLLAVFALTNLWHAVVQVKTKQC
uniref:Family with sequence similarity 220 member A n=1 Tax=Crocodylus porosus TaxID=8502 RepID=A0A7M4EDE7_CROPO